MNRNNDEFNETGKIVNKNNDIKNKELLLWVKLI